jgi:hypothetical protein
MEESERQEMLSELNATKLSLEDNISKFPLSMKTISIQKRKLEMEQQLERVEKNIGLFSKDIVYIGI